VKILKITKSNNKNQISYLFINNFKL